MGFCGALFRTSAYILVAVIAVLAYFHLECQKEKEAEGGETNRFDPFDPEQTDARDVTLNFYQKGDPADNHIGLAYILKPFAPCAVVKLVTLIEGIFKEQTDFKVELSASRSIYEFKNVLARV